MSGDDVINKPLTAAQKESLDRIAARQAAGEDSQIDYSDIPALTEDQLANAVTIRPNRAREYVGVRLDWDVLFWLKEKGPGYSTRINQILRAVMEMSEGKSRKVG